MAPSSGTVWLRVRRGKCVSALALLFAVSGCRARTAGDQTVDAGALPDAGPSDAGGGSSNDASAPTATRIVVLPTPGGPCQPTGGGPHWVTEGDSLEVSLSCATGRKLEGKDVRVQSLPEGASYDRVTRTLRWTPALDQAAVYDLAIELVGENERGQLRIGVADAFADPDNVPIVDPSQYPFEYGLPVFFLNDPEHDEYVDSELVYAGRDYSIEIKTRGATSLSYPQHSYTLEFDNDDLFQESEASGGLTNRRKLVLTTTFDDTTHVRQRMAHDLWRQLDPAHLGVKSFSAVVYIDGKYHGLYAATDHIDRHLMGNLGLSGGGELFKSRSHSGSFATEKHGMTKEAGLPVQGETGWDAPLQELIDFTRRSNDETFFRSLGEYVTVAEYQNWYVFMMLTASTDTTGKNAYHYLENRDATFRTIPWDFNASFGQSFKTLRTSAQSSLLFLNRNLIWERMVQDPRSREELLTRFHDAMRGSLSLDSVLQRFDAQVAEVSPSAARNGERWGSDFVDYRAWRSRKDFTTFDEEVAYVRSWIVARWTFIDERIDSLLEAAVADEGGEPGSIDDADSGLPFEGSPDEGQPDGGTDGGL